MNILHESALTYCTPAEKGVIAENIAENHFIAHGYEVSKPKLGTSPYDFIVINPELNTRETVQVKHIYDNKLKTYSSGAGKDKGGKRKRISYAKCGIDWLVGVNIETNQVFCYHHDYYCNKQSISVYKHPSQQIMLIKNRGFKQYGKNYEHVTLDEL
jgi:hypothetical protein